MNGVRHLSKETVYKRSALFRGARHRLIDCVVILPARHGSKRFPAKVLAELGGKSVLRRCWEAALKSRTGPVWIATESRKVAEHARSFGARAVLTSSSCRSGTDRVHEALKRVARGLPGLRFVINLQADEPFMRPSTIRKVYELLRDDPEADISTAAVPLRDEAKIKNPNVVKVAVGRNEKALYFSRSPIPYYAIRDTQYAIRSPNKNRLSRLYWQHVGIYGFRKKSLEKFVRWPQSPLERLEKLEQLRALENGLTIAVAKVRQTALAIDTPEDLKIAQKRL